MKTFKTFLIVILAMVICCSNAVAQEWQTRSKKTMTGKAARLQMEAMRATDPDLRYPKDRVNLYDCGQKDIVAWGYFRALNDAWTFAPISVCDKEPEDRFNPRSVSDSLDTAQAYLFPIKCQGPSTNNTCID
jgi:hypothetical protein